MKKILEIIGRTILIIILLLIMFVIVFWFPITLGYIAFKI